MFRSILYAAACIIGITAQAADLKVSIVGAKPATGQLLISIFDRSETWMKTPVASQTLNVAADGSSMGTFSLPSGTYAIALIHDANGNGKMDTNALGITTEAFGFSNGARARFGPPAFTKAAFQLTDPCSHLTISIDRAKR